MAKEELLLLTVPTDYVGDGEKPPKMARAYDRVVGIGRQGGTEWSTRLRWHRTDLLPDLHWLYRRGEAQAHPLEVDSEFAQQLVEFFGQFFTAKAVGEIEYNCHRFAYWMEGLDWAQIAFMPDEPKHIAEQGLPVRNNLDLGTHGVLGIREHGVHIYHSLVGLGVDTPQCLHVTNTDGFMGLDVYERVIDNYTRLKHLEELELFAIEPPIG